MVTLMIYNIKTCYLISIQYFIRSLETDLAFQKFQRIEKHHEWYFSNVNYYGYKVISRSSGFIAGICVKIRHTDIWHTSYYAQIR